MIPVKDRILYEDNHLIIVNKLPGELVQGDETGDRTLADDVKEYLRVTYNKPGNVGIDECMIWGDYYYAEALMRIINPERRNCW